MKKIALLLAVLLLPMMVLAADQVPYKVTLASTGTLVFGPGTNDRCLGAPPNLDDGRGNSIPTQWWVTDPIVSVGQSTLMGLVVNVQTHCIAVPAGVDPNVPIPLPPGSEMYFVAGEAELTAANGDKIFGTYAGTLTVVDEHTSTIDGTFHTYDGTGRFVGATGDGHAVGVQVDGSSAVTITGTMTSPGAAKRNK